MKTITVSLGLWLGLAAVATAQSTVAMPTQPGLDKLSAHRERLIAWLNDYTAQGVFVSNPDPQGTPGHYLLDAKGRPCPLANLIIKSGRRDLVDALALTSNGIKVADVTSGPLYDWILISGLTKEECILIQEPSLPGDERPELPMARVDLATKLAATGKALATQTAKSVKTAYDRLVLELSTRRQAHLRALRAYWMKGEFVQNPDPKGGPGHFILDAKGRPCPLAHIIIQSGRRDLVEALARTNNGIKVADAQEAALTEWISTSGLTREDCILIQKPGMSGDDRVVQQSRADLKRQLARVETELSKKSRESLRIVLERLLAKLA